MSAESTTWEPCGRGICAANEGHEGTCPQASGWAEGEERTRVVLAPSIAATHEARVTRTTRGDQVIRDRACTCGHALPWDGWEDAFRVHLVEVTERAVRHQIAKAIADRYRTYPEDSVGYDEGAVDAFDISEQIAYGEMDSPAPVTTETCPYTHATLSACAHCGFDPLNPEEAGR